MACTQRHIQFVFSFLVLLLLISSSTQVRFMVQGRLISSPNSNSNSNSNSKPVETTTTQMDGNDQEKGSLIVRVNIGSRPPRCERVMRCNSCRHCEAVQVPAIPQDKQGNRKQLNSRGDGQLSKISTRGDDTSNYKPMSWKCKCGDLIFNP